MAARRARRVPLHAQLRGGFQWLQLLPRARALALLVVNKTQSLFVQRLRLLCLASLVHRNLRLGPVTVATSSFPSFLSPSRPADQQLANSQLLLTLANHGCLVVLDAAAAPLCRLLSFLFPIAPVLVSASINCFWLRTWACQSFEVRLCAGDSVIQRSNTRSPRPRLWLRLHLTICLSNLTPSRTNRYQQTRAHISSSNVLIRTNA